MPRRRPLTPASSAALVICSLTVLGLAALWAGPTAGVLVGLLMAVVGLLLWRTGGGGTPSAVGLGVTASGLMVAVLSVAMWGYLVSRANEPVRPEKDPNIGRQDPVLTSVRPSPPTGPSTTARP